MKPSLSHASLVKLGVLAVIFLLSLCCFFKSSLTFYQAKTNHQDIVQQASILSSSLKALQKLKATTLGEEHLFSEIEKQLAPYQLTFPENLKKITPAIFQDNLRHHVLAIKERAKGSSLPEDFFLGLNHYETVPPSSQDLKQVFEEEALLRIITTSLLNSGSVTLDQFDFQKKTQETPTSSLASSRGTLSITFTCKEAVFKKFFNKLVKSPYLFIIENMHVENSAPLPPIRDNSASPPTISTSPTSTPIHFLFGLEKVTVTMRIGLLHLSLPKNTTTSAALDHTPTTQTKAEKILGLDQDLSWTIPGNSPQENRLLFTSYPYYLQGEKLVDPMNTTAPLYPPVPNKWLVQHHLDYTNPHILSEDSDHDGFTNLEEWRGSNPYKFPGSEPSNPNDPTSHPLLWTKLSCHPSDIHQETYSLEFTDVETENGKEVFSFQPRKPIPNLTSQGRFCLNTKIRTAHLGETIPGTSLKLIAFEKKETIHKEVPYDTSRVTLLNPQTEQKWTLTYKSLLHPKPTEITLTGTVTLHYLLTTSLQELHLQQGDTFTLQSRPDPAHQGKRDSETYQLIAIQGRESLILEHKGKRYILPVFEKNKEL